MRVAARFVMLAIALACAVGFTLVRNRYDLEDSSFLAALAAFCVAATTSATVASLALRNAIRSALIHGATAGLLVPLLYGAWVFPVHIGACSISGGVCDSS
jgi:predicted ABC-type sugar transport system permease subunit